MFRVHGQVPNPIPAPHGKDRSKVEGTDARTGKGQQTQGTGRGPELDSHAIAVALSVAAKEAKEKELSFEEIIRRVVDETGMTNPQAAMEEANRRIQKEIEETIEEIKKNKDLMEEAEGWEEFGKLLESQMTEEQLKEFFGLINNELQ
ncbi:hypothetical protein A2276_07860 [candidate division WOR-1 bacterium RIFOXYA12_FULL_43_27]|uniref:Uncharacterized protein n=1 Tax=candidate division WOR-1 bacterium RIFOXYC2_FULL_46_14 TaxID=1802587 RepID=A0A1F4U5Y8_UNCSA|nr:MAG: hypothetical protein A2276_07860 [candidate division WOR-1 bacterium RIFOXYA12_FULL_43_27]OGC20512.1 MAG: hypothetical protein A2292_05685 [candidate division WOR-1 bacterium RIFOXYB2_FULL_46_45]OGC31751.1 MAG: hypothetical protein A2232_05765 [candidate division WOR-1 bacterium RIFOXYA2_FULL_46_56]OGC40356.1 MAG: hypothetical protein A2438_03705 [candidate division WOR-1 bacterium RIFOXYC2_FULL_46_14]